MSNHKWIQTALLGLITIYSASTQSCSFDAAIVVIADLVRPVSILGEFPDPQMRFFRDMLRFTEQQTQQLVENAIQHFSTQFGLDFSNIEPNDANQRFLGNAMFQPIKVPFNASAIANRWILTGNSRSRCFPVGSGSLRVIFNDTMMLHGMYGGVDGRPVNAGDFLLYGYFAIFDACPQQPMLIQFQGDTPARVLPVEGWLIEEGRLYNRQLGRGRSQNTVKNSISQDDPTMVMIKNQLMMSFP